MKLLKTAIENQRWDVAAHALVIGMVKAKQEAAHPTSNGKRKRSNQKPKRR